MTNPLTTDLAITICVSPSDAIRQGILYRPPIYKPIEVKQAVVVRNGTQANASTIDFVLEDENGQKYVFMVTQKLIKMLGQV